ncbi:MAG: hypothetical protein OXG44_15995 [Gammaproteobacteria bacterium]|nr:hypothetical protein [Gammaproteobacteria bacterium]
MRIRISMPDYLVEELDRRAGDRPRDAFVCELMRRGLDEHRWGEIDTSLGAVEDAGHEWDRDPGAWVQQQRRGDRRRSG